MDVLGAAAAPADDDNDPAGDDNDLPEHARHLVGESILEDLPGPSGGDTQEPLAFLRRMAAATANADDAATAPTAAAASAEPLLGSAARPLDHPATGQEQPLSEFATDGMLTMAFAHLLPFATGDPTYCVGRTSEVSFRDGAAFVMSYKDRRFARDPRFPLYLYNRVIRHSALTQARFFLSGGHAGHLTMPEIQRQLDGPDKGAFLAAQMQSYMGNIPGSAQSHVRARYNAEALMNERGVPTVFLTMRCAWCCLPR
jgi:hypothetical protein